MVLHYCNLVVWFRGIAIRHGKSYELWLFLTDLIGRVRDKKNSYNFKLLTELILYYSPFETTLVAISHCLTAPRKRILIRGSGQYELP